MREGYIREDFRFFAMYQQAFHDQQWDSVGVGSSQPYFVGNNGPFFVGRLGANQ